MQSSKEVSRIERKSAQELDAHRITNKRKGDKRNKPQRGTGYKGNFRNAIMVGFDPNVMLA